MKPSVRQRSKRQLGRREIARLRPARSRSDEAHGVRWLIVRWLLDEASRRCLLLRFDRWKSPPARQALLSLIECDAGGRMRAGGGYPRVFPRGWRRDVVGLGVGAALPSALPGVGRGSEGDAWRLPLRFFLPCCSQTHARHLPHSDSTRPFLLHQMSRRSLTHHSRSPSSSSSSSTRQNTTARLSLSPSPRTLAPSQRSVKPVAPPLRPRIVSHLKTILPLRSPPETSEHTSGQWSPLVQSDGMPV